MSREPDWLTVLRNRQRALWLLAILFYGIGDTVTTRIGWSAEHTAEAGPIALPLIETAGIGGLVALKLVFFGLCYLAWYLVESPGRVAIPLALAVAGIGVTLWNSVMLLL